MAIIDQESSAERPAGRITVTSRDYAPLTRSIIVNIFICTDHDGWVGWLGENKDLGIRVATSSRFPFKHSRWFNFRKLRERILEDIDFIVDMYLVQKKDRVTTNFREIIDRWKDHADPSRRVGKKHWEPVDITGSS